MYGKFAKFFSAIFTHFKTCFIKKLLGTFSPCINLSLDSCNKKCIEAVFSRGG